MTLEKFKEDARRRIRFAATTAADVGVIYKGDAQYAIEAAEVQLWGKKSLGADGEVHPSYNDLFVVWVPRGTVSGRWHRAVDWKGREGSVIVWGEPDEWEFAGKLYVGRKTADGSFPFEVSKVSAEVSVYDAPLAVVKERMAEYAALKRESHCQQCDEL